MTTTQARHNLFGVIEAAGKGTHTVIVQGQKRRKVAVLLSFEEYQRLTTEREGLDDGQ